MPVGPRPLFWKTPANLLIPFLSLESPLPALCVVVISRRCIGRPGVTSMTGNASLNSAVPLVTKLTPLDAWVLLEIAKPLYHSATLKLLLLVINSTICLRRLSRHLYANTRTSIYTVQPLAVIRCTRYRTKANFSPVSLASPPSISGVELSVTMVLHVNRIRKLY